MFKAQGFKKMAWMFLMVLLVCQCSVMQAGADFSPDESRFNGAAHTSVPIVAAPGLSPATTPDAALIYSSMHGNGQVGEGWDLTHDYIRVTKHKPFHIGCDNDVELVTDGLVRKLVRLQGDEFRFAVEEDAYALVRRISIEPENLDDQGKYRWEVAMPDGTVYHYGTTMESRMNSWQLGKPQGETTRWYLDRVVDANGNEMVLRYFDYFHMGENWIHLKEISYGSQKTGGMQNRILFAW